jgi:hypothetical protein
MAVAIVILASLGPGCARQPVEREGGDQKMPSRPIEQVLEAHTDQWMAIPGVAGTGIGECAGEPCIRIFVVEKTPALVKQFPSRIEGYVVDIQETGAFRARESP